MPASRRALPFAFILALAPLSAAQLEYGGAPPSSYLPLPGAVPTIVMPPVDEAALLAEDAAQEGKGPLRFGQELAVDLGFEAGLWTALASGDRVWRLRVSSPGARSLSFVLTEYDLPAGGELYAYDDARLSTYGQFNDLNENPDGGMAIRPLPGDAVTLEYLEPAGVEHPAVLRVGTVVHDYLDVLALLEDGDGAADGACEVDVACPVGVPWQQQTRAVTHLLIGGTLCTGSLLNNTAFDGTQLYITANHCGSLGSAIFRFKYQKSGCGSGSAPTNLTVQGSTQLATSTSLDYRLVRINPAIPASYEPFFAGWDRTGAYPPNTATIHHPGGDPKKISLDDDAPAKTGTQWRILQWDLGVTEGGSSGCPLYSSAGRFIGQLWGGAAFCGYPFDDYFGRMDVQWSQIASFLDPLGTGAAAIDGFDPSGGGPTGPDITGITPASVNALIPGSAQTVSIIGSGFTPSTTVEVDGVLLFGIPAPYTVLSANLITLDMPQVDNLGPVTVKVADAGGSDTGQITVVAPALPKLQAGHGDEPVTALSVAGIDLLMSSLQNDLFFLLWSPSGLPSTLPGIVSLEIGNGFAQVFGAGSFAIDATKAWNKVHVNLAGVPPFTTFFLEGVVVRASGFAYPLDSSNRQECLLLF